MNTNNDLTTPLKVGIAGSGSYSVQAVNSLADNPHFTVEWALTPTPKPVGRHKTITPSSLERWAQAKNIPVVNVAKSLQPLREKIKSLPSVDYLLVVSFGYLIPNWLLELPTKAPVNVHPSSLPRWRGSSPGQFTILYGDQTASVTIMKMNNKFDQGAIIAQLPLAINSQTTQDSYYQQAFQVVAQKLPHILNVYGQQPQSTAQPTPPPDLPVARKLTRNDGFIPFLVLKLAQQGSTNPVPAKLAAQCGPVLTQLLQHQPQLTPAQLIDRATRALNPWPGVWTTTPSYKGRADVRTKIHKVTYNKSQQQITLRNIQYAGEKAKQL